MKQNTSDSTSKIELINHSSSKINEKEKLTEDKIFDNFNKNNNKNDDENFYNEKYNKNIKEKTLNFITMSEDKSMYIKIIIFFQLT